MATENWPYEAELDPLGELASLPRLDTSEREGDLLLRAVALVEILHENFDHFLTQYKMGEFDPLDREGLAKTTLELAALNRRTSDMFLQIVAILEPELCRNCGRDRSAHVSGNPHGLEHTFRP